MLENNETNNNCILINHQVEDVENKNYDPLKTSISETLTGIFVQKSPFSSSIYQENFLNFLNWLVVFQLLSKNEYRRKCSMFPMLKHMSPMGLRGCVVML